MCDVPDFLRKKMSQHEFEFARNVSPYTKYVVIWAYDLTEDIHYFFV